MTENAAVEVQKASRVYGAGSSAVRALDEVSLTIRRGEFFTLLGPSGCGKTTLLRLIAGFETPTTGQILIDGKDVSQTPPNQRRVNTVFQSYALFPHLTVSQNIGFGLEMLGRPRAQIKDAVARMLALVKMEKMADRRPQMLSGGQQQRVALARALAPEPEVLLLDEPLSALDLKLRKEMQLELKRLQTETGITFVFVTHDQEEALTMSDRIGVMSAGNLLQVGAPREIYNRPVNRFVADFIGETNFLTATIRNGIPRLSNGEAVQAKGPARLDGKTVTLAVRPEQVRIDPEGPIHATIAQTVYFGTDTHCHLRLADGTELVARLQSPPSGDIGLKAGEKVRIGFVPGAVQMLEG
ncbi:spermidine/putrescine ABC transporter ATP-binding protein [Oceanicola sp. 22II-s10i]|uniref:ABC transporter ATP-binding protein n=1 Tax=Oceanicola sp. 22II-s10i TaxID=1317116 RepID=UPI000B520901|nr:ABC transporter ATP-binding protein [Oceanicola sp. 22II-s10i]OWU85704.1 spermidine/putrescine ABC transporter ATP-binding protein [Oceanicola sp. 22II-s10i]